MERIVNILDAKTNLSKLVADAEQGDTIILARNGKPAAKIVPIEVKKPVYGLYKGILPSVGLDAFAALTDEEMKELGFDELAPLGVIKLVLQFALSCADDAKLNNDAVE